MVFADRNGALHRDVVLPMGSHGSRQSGLVSYVMEGDAAEAVCRELQARYPDQVDSIWRLATVCEGRGDRHAAARYYRDAAEFMRSRNGFDAESIAHMVQSAERMEAEPSAPANAGERASCLILSRRLRHA